MNGGRSSAVNVLAGIPVSGSGSGGRAQKPKRETSAASFASSASSASEGPDTLGSLRKDSSSLLLGGDGSKVSQRGIWMIYVNCTFVCAVVLQLFFKSCVAIDISPNSLPLVVCDPCAALVDIWIASCTHACPVAWFATVVSRVVACEHWTIVLGSSRIRWCHILTVSHAFSTLHQQL